MEVVVDETGVTGFPAGSPWFPQLQRPPEPPNAVGTLDPAANLFPFFDIPQITDAGVPHGIDIDRSTGAVFTTVDGSPFAVRRLDPGVNLFTLRTLPEGSTRALGIVVNAIDGNVYFVQPDVNRISRLDPGLTTFTGWPIPTLRATTWSRPRGSSSSTAPSTRSAARRRHPARGIYRESEAGGSALPALRRIG